MNDDQIRRVLEVAEQPLAPAPEFASMLLDELRGELKLDRRPRTSQRTTGVRGSVSTPDRSRLGLMLVAAVVLVSALGVMTVGGLRDERVPPPAADDLAVIHAAGRIRIAIRPDHPQFSVGGQSTIGFDKDVADAIAASLGVEPAIVVVGVDEMIGGDASTWDIAMPSRPVWSIDGGAFQVTDPYYFWRHRLIVLEASSATNVAALKDQPICAVDGDGGAGWLRGTYGPTLAEPITEAIVLRGTDAECLDALQRGDVAAMVTATMSDADIDVRSGIRMLEGPGPEPRAVIVRRQPGGTESTLAAAVDGVISELHADGTLVHLSESRFGGDDLSRP